LEIAAQKDPSNPSSPHSYDKDCLAAPADVRFTIRFENREAESHNVDILDHPGGTSLFTGKIFKGPKTVTYKVNPLPAGTYYFRCDVHALVMNGTLIVGG
jgi:plastocyanin